MAAVVLVATPVLAATTAVTSPIQAGRDGTVVGEATFTRTHDDTGDVLVVDYTVPGGIEKTHVCISTTPFTSRVAPGQCPYSQGATGTTAHYEIPLGSEYDGQTVYVQAHAVTQGATAYAGYQRSGGNSFYGNVAVEDPAGPGTPVPVGTLGAIALTAAVAGGAAVRSRRRSVRS